MNRAAFYFARKHPIAAIIKKEPEMFAESVEVEYGEGLQRLFDLNQTL